MNKTTIITEGQSLMDVAIQELGTVAALFDLAAANGLAITDALLPGQVLSIPPSLVAQPELSGYFQSSGQRINTDNDSASTAPVVVPEAGIFDETYAPVFE